MRDDELDVALTPLSAFLGKWSGRGWTVTRDGRVDFEQTEDVQSRLGGKLLTIEGRANRPGDRDDVRFRAFAVVRVDLGSGRFLWQAYSADNSIEVELQQTKSGFRWELDADGDVRMRFDIALDDSTWVETGQMSADAGQTWQPSLEMRLSRRPN